MSRSVRFRTEIGGTTGARLWCVSTSETGVSVSGVVVPGGVILGTGDRMSRAGPLRAGSAGARVCPGGGSGDVGTIDAADRCSRVPGAVVTAITQHEKPCPDARARQGRSMVHTRPCPASVGTAESCGKVILVATMVLLPCA